MWVKVAKHKAEQFWVRAVLLVCAPFHCAPVARVFANQFLHGGDTGSTGKVWGCLIFPTRFALSWQPGCWGLLGINPALEKDSKSDLKRQ